MGNNIRGGEEKNREIGNNIGGEEKGTRDRE